MPSNFCTFETVSKQVWIDMHGIRRICMLGVVSLAIGLLAGGCFVFKKKDCNCPTWSHELHGEDENIARIEPANN